MKFGENIKINHFWANPSLLYDTPWPQGGNSELCTDCTVQDDIRKPTLKCSLPRNTLSGMEAQWSAHKTAQCPGTGL